MSRYRKPKRNYLNWINWLGRVGLVLIIILFIASIIKKESPLEIVKNSFSRVTGNTTDPNSMNKKNLRILVAKKEHIIDSLLQIIDNCESGKGKKAVVQVNSPTLNMRSGASLSSSIIMQIPNGSQVIINYFDSNKYYLDGKQGQWCNILYANTTGWVWGPYLNVIN